MTEESTELQERTNKFLEKIKKSNAWLAYAALAAILWFSYYIRTRNLPLLTDIITGKYIAADLDAQLFMRYSQYIVEHGKLFAVDYLRNYPVGFPMESESPLLSYFIVYFYKFLHLINPSITIEYADTIYPAVVTILSLIFFFLFVRKLFNNNLIAVIATAFLSVLPSFLTRTMTGYSDKEALAVVFMFAAFYFYVASWKSEKIKQSIIYGALAGITTTLTGLVWGGVNFLFLIIGLFVIIEIILGRFRKEEFYAYVPLYIAMIAPLLFFGGTRFTVKAMITSTTAIPISLAFLMAVVDYFVIKKDMLKIRERLTRKLPGGIVVFLISLIIALLAISIFEDVDFAVHKPYSLVYDMIYPLKDRWALTVQESHEPYITDWISQFGSVFLFLFIGASILMVYEMTKKLKKYRWWIVTFYTAFIMVFIFSRYSQNSVFNGVSSIAKVMYIGSLAIFIIGIILLYVYTLKKDKEAYYEITRIEKSHIFTLIFFIVMVMAARRAIRLVFIFAPVVAVLTGYLSFKTAEYAKMIKKDVYKIGVYLAVLIITVYFFAGFAQSSLENAKYTGSIYNVQWQKAMGWVRNNTQEDAVFAHWWDYGYMVQTGGERATVTDGGNAIGYWNHLMGRNVLTGQSDQEALEFLYAHNVSYLLIVEDEIGKYPAFSSIGSDANYDRYSWINIFTLDRSQTQETRDETVYVYRGGTPLDEEFVYNDAVFPRGSSGIGGFIIAMRQSGEEAEIKQPTAVLFFNGKQTRVPLECIWLNGREIRFPEPGLKGCLQIVPSIQDQKADPAGAAFYLSERVYKGRVGQYYMLGKKSENFELVYSDEKEMPLAIYNGRIIGPTKIWKVNYPEGMVLNQTYLDINFPDPSVTKI